MTVSHEEKLADLQRDLDAHNEHRREIENDMSGILAQIHQTKATMADMDRIKVDILKHLGPDVETPEALEWRSKYEQVEAQLKAADEALTRSSESMISLTEELMQTADLVSALRSQLDDTEAKYDDMTKARNLTAENRDKYRNLYIEVRGELADTIAARDEARQQLEVAQHDLAQTKPTYRTAGERAAEQAPGTWSSDASPTSPRGRLERDLHQLAATDRDNKSWRTLKDVVVAFARQQLRANGMNACHMMDTASEMIETLL